MTQSFHSNLLNDLTFKKLFASPATLSVTKQFLIEVAGIQVKEVSLKPSEVYSIEHFTKAEKENDLLLTKVDLLVELETGQLVTIELQNKFQVYFFERALFYMAKGYLANYDEAEKSATARKNKYGSLQPIYGVNIVNFSLHEGAVSQPVMHYRLRSDEYDLVLKSRQTEQELWGVIFFELPKVTADSLPIIREWQSLFVKGEVSADAPEYLQQAATFIAFENLDWEERQMYIEINEREAIKEAELLGAHEEGHRKGHQEGLAEGLQKGQIRGRESERLSLAQEMLKRKYPLKEIQGITGLSMAELEKLQH